MSTFSFAAERYDRRANAYFDYTIIYYRGQGGNELEVIENKSKRRFAARGSTKLTLGQLYAGSKVAINAFQFTIVDYNDEATRTALSKLHETTLGIVQGMSFASLGKIMTAATGFGFTITRLQTINVSAAAQGVLRGAGLRVARGPAAFMVLLRPGAVEEWQKLKNRFGSPEDVHGSADAEVAAAEIDHVFNSDLLAKETSAHTDKKSSLCLIKPHAVAAGHGGAIVQQLIDNLHVSAVELINLSKEDALEFLTCYRGVLPEFSAQVAALYSGPAVAVEVWDDSPEVDVVGALRQIAGPFDVTCAQCLAPDSLRAKYGENNVENAVHVTDLPTDGQIETNFFFRVLKT